MHFPVTHFVHGCAWVQANASRMDLRGTKKHGGMALCRALLFVSCGQASAGLLHNVG
jgi:hypothetical protein